MGRFQKTLKKYERHFLLGLVILLLLTFSVGGAIQCQNNQRSGEVDYGGEFLVNPSKSDSLDNNEFISWLRRLDGYRPTVQSPSLRYEAFMRRQPPDDRMRSTWSHILTTEAARAAGYQVGEEWQLKDAVRKAVLTVMRGMPFNDATYDRFIRDIYRRSPKEFEETVREVVMKDAFVRPLVETPRFETSYEQAYEVWKNLLERVDLEYVALAGADFNLAALQQEHTRERIGAQLELLDAVSRTASDLDPLDTRVQGWLEAHDGTAPENLDALTDTNREDRWGTPFRYTRTEDGYDLRSAGPDTVFESSDDVTLATVAQLKTRAALREVGDALLRWREATGSWPETLEALREAPTEGALAPLTGTALDAWDRPLAYDASGAGETPTLSSHGPDGEAGGGDDVVALVGAEDVLVPAGRELVPWLLAEDRDAWDRPLRIDLAHALATRPWSVTSAGPDGEMGTDDDLDTGNQKELAAFYERPQVKIDFEVPERREFEALYVHLPLVPDASLAWLLETYPQHRPDEEEAFNRWRQLHEFSYYLAENPGDPESGHGAAHAKEVAPDAPAILIPGSTVFGEAPASLLVEDDEDRKAYVEEGWRPILLRELFLENVLDDLLTRARESHEALAAWTEKKQAFDAGLAGEDPGEKPEVFDFQDFLGGELAGFLPKEGEAPWLGFFRTEEPLERVDIESLPELGGISLTDALQGLEEDDRYAATPTILNDSHTRAILHLIRDEPRHDRPLEEVRDEVFDRFVESKRLDLAAKALEGLRKEVGAASLEPEAEGEDAPSRDELWTRAVEAWAAKQDVPVYVEQTGRFIGPNPPARQELGEDADPAEVARAQRRDFVRAKGYDALRKSVKAGDPLEQGELATSILRDDDLADGSNTAFLVRLTSVGVPPRAAFSPRAYADYLSVEILGGSKGGRRLGAASGAERVTGSFGEGLRHFYYDFPWLKGKFDLRTEYDPSAPPRE